MMLFIYELFNLSFEHINHVRSKFELLFHGDRQFHVLFELFFFLVFSDVILICLLDGPSNVATISASLVFVLIISIHESHAVDAQEIHLWTGSSNLVLISTTGSVRKDLLFLARGWNST